MEEERGDVLQKGATLEAEAGRSSTCRVEAGERNPSRPTLQEEAGGPCQWQSPRPIFVIHGGYSSAPPSPPSSSRTSTLRSPRPRQPWQGVARDASWAVQPGGSRRRGHILMSPQPRRCKATGRRPRQ